MFKTVCRRPVWRGLRQITNYKPRAPHSTNDIHLANDLNEFYCRFERQLDCPELPLPLYSDNSPFRRVKLTDFSRGRTPAKQLGRTMSLQPP